jgi:hypothetical protein
MKSPLDVGSYWMEWDNCRLPNGYYFVSKADQNWITVQRVGNPCKTVVSTAKISCAVDGDPVATGLWKKEQ